MGQGMNQEDRAAPDQRRRRGGAGPRRHRPGRARPAGRPAVVYFEGGIRPSTLPRSKPAPVTVEMNGSIKTTDKSVPPRLARISLQINSHGSLNPKGLPTCNLASISPGTGAAAKRVCGSSLIGHGNVTSRIAFPSQEPFLSIGGMEAFNGTYKHRPAIFAQVSSQTPLSLTYVIVFEVKKTHGALRHRPERHPAPHSLGLRGDLKLLHDPGQKVQLPRALRRAMPRPAARPRKGISEVGFDLARATYEFEGGVTMSNELNKQCKAKG